MLRLVFCGTPDFALPSLNVLAAHPEFEIVGVMTQPDRPSGRGQKLVAPPIKQRALELGLEVVQPERLRKEPDMVDWLKQKAPDYLVTAAFGQILSQDVLDIPRYGTVNVHASLLPRYRGANPVQWAILNGDAQTGVTLMLTELGLDSGPMLRAVHTPIDPNETAETLYYRLADLGAEALPQTLLDYANGQIHPVLQDDALVTHAPKREKADAALDWSLDAQTLHNRIRGQYPWPGAITFFQGEAIKLFESRLHPDAVSGRIGDITILPDQGLLVKTGSGTLLIQTVQPSGKGRIPATAWANGALQKSSAGLRFETETLSV